MALRINRVHPPPAPPPPIRSVTLLDPTVSEKTAELHHVTLTPNGHGGLTVSTGAEVRASRALMTWSREDILELADLLRSGRL